MYAGVAANGYTYNVTFIDNHFENMILYAISLDFETEDNLVYHNNFVNCSSYYTNYCVDQGVDNYWYSETLQEGNYWSNWVSGPYALEGSAGTYDLYPLGSMYIISEYIISTTMISIISLITLLSIVVVSMKRK